jgi:hypothetical protein
MDDLPPPTPAHPASGGAVSATESAAPSSSSPARVRRRRTRATTVARISARSVADGTGAAWKRSPAVGRAREHAVEHQRVDVDMQIDPSAWAAPSATCVA